MGVSDESGVVKAEIDGLAVGEPPVLELSDGANGGAGIEVLVRDRPADSEDESGVESEVDSEDDELDGEPGTSKLGRHDYWETTYTKERQNLRDLGDVGEIWFGEDVLEKMLHFITFLVTEEPELDMDVPILDIGTGNGVLPIQLRKQGFTNVAGSDYSRASIELCNEVALAEGVDGVRFLHDDLLDSSLTDRYAVITDKGTLDAIGLSCGHVQNRQRYRHAVRELLEPRGLLVITSCNSTKEELVAEFCGAWGCAPDGATAAGEGLSCADRHDGHHAPERLPDARELTGICVEGGTEGDVPNGSCMEDATEGNGSSGSCVEAAPRVGMDISGGSGTGDGSGEGPCALLLSSVAKWEYVDHVRIYPVFQFGGVEGSRVATVALRRVG